jgi:hypothetical protein
MKRKVGFSRGIAIVDGEHEVRGFAIDLFEKRKLSQLEKAAMSIDKRGFRAKFENFGLQTGLQKVFQ